LTRRLLLLIPLLLPLLAGAATIHNDDSCDVGLFPAATLLLPYFEVDLEAYSSSGETTLFTVTNVTNVERIARVTLWTDYAFPILTFNIYLTGYDVQSINLFDVISRGVIAPDTGTGTAVSRFRGKYSDPNGSLDLTDCARLPGNLDASVVRAMQDAFTLGVLPEVGTRARCEAAGGEHDHAVGYATIDVVSNCSTHMPTEHLYWLDDIAFDNALVGDYMQVNSSKDSAESSAMVHIRAVPEGGTVAERRARPQNFDAGFPRTFYSRYQFASEPRFDGRQPLPSVFAARWINGSVASYKTSYKIWREGRTNGRSCALRALDRDLGYAEAVKFDEAENAVGSRIPLRADPPFDNPHILAPTSRIDANDSNVFPQLTNGAVAGWMYLNLDNCDDATPGCGDAAASQNWVITSIRAQNRFSADMDAAPLGNGCSPKAGLSEPNLGTAVIGPAANENRR
jgi:hypothetical protein